MSLRVARRRQAALDAAIERTARLNDDEWSTSIEHIGHRWPGVRAIEEGWLR